MKQTLNITKNRAKNSNKQKREKEMEFSTLFFLIFHVLLFSPAISDPRISEAGHFCDRTLHSPTSNFIPNFVTLMQTVSDQINRNRWAEANITSPPPEIYAFAQCHEDLSPSDCSACFAASRTRLPRCLPAVSARIFLDGCFLRYDNYSFDGAGESVRVDGSGDARDMARCGPPRAAAVDAAARAEFGRKVRDVVGVLAETAAINGGFGVGEDRGGVGDVYALAQCWRTVGKEECRRCLRAAGDRVGECSPAAEGRAMFAGCFLRYSTERFFEVRTTREDEDSTGVSLIVAGVLSSVAFVLLVLVGVYFGAKAISSYNKQDICDEISIAPQNSRLNFKYEMLEKATDFFDTSRKLGQGGSGSVFKGTLPDGRIVAVKRLFYNTRQWVDEFFNEVNLLSGVEHKNLVKLLGCSIEGPESLLVYEFVPNKSLDQLLFDKNTISILSWQHRFNIVAGTAEGLAYLHGGCGVKIIHRDIKTSNILLGENLNPKIADFGLARSIATDRTHVSTGIAGTLGYMAPEYLVRGQLNDKADVYAFGVVVLEIVCGRKNSAFTLGSSSLLHSVWKLYKENKIADSVDPTLKGDFPVKEASDVLQIGLLCTQASVALRPSMSDVVQMLCDKECEIPSPMQPPFLNASLLNSDDSKTASDGQNTTEVSVAYTANSNTIYESFCEITVASRPG